jgi:hypothetical protein
MVRLDARGNLLLGDKVAPEEDERISRSRDVALGLPFGMRLLRQGFQRGLRIVDRGSRIWSDGAESELEVAGRRWTFGSGQLMR